MSDQNGGYLVGSVDDQVMVGTQFFQCQFLFSGEIVCWHGNLCEVGDVSSTGVWEKWVLLLVIVVIIVIIVIITVVLFV